LQGDHAGFLQPKEIAGRVRASLTRIKRIESCVEQQWPLRRGSDFEAVLIRDYMMDQVKQQTSRSWE
jgi:hypothetical protein